MKIKTIKKVLKKKFTEWTQSIKDEELRKLVEKNTIITGGSIASLLLKETVNDYDIYFRTKEVCRKVAEYYVFQFQASTDVRFAGDPEKKVKIVVEERTDRIYIRIQSAGAVGEGQDTYKYFEAAPESEAEDFAEDATKQIDKLDDASGENLDKGEPFRPVFMSCNAITLSSKVQVVTRFFGEPGEIHENYDFVHCTSYWSSWDENLVTPEEALRSLLTKELRYVGSKYPLCSVIRTRKFIGRGWTINAGQYLKMLMQLNELDLTSFTVLQDQLIGVDAAYFMQILSTLKEKDPEKVNGAYLMTIIDRIF